MAVARWQASEAGEQYGAFMEAWRELDTESLEAQRPEEDALNDIDSLPRSVEGM